MRQRKGRREADRAIQKIRAAWAPAGTRSRLASGKSAAPPSASRTTAAVTGGTSSRIVRVTTGEVPKKRLAMSRTSAATPRSQDTG